MTFEDLLDAKGKVNPRAWSALWADALKYPPLFADDPDPVVAEAALDRWRERVRGACRVVIAASTAISVTVATVGAQILATKANVLRDIGVKLLERAESTDEPAALVGTVVGPLLFAGNKAALWQVSALWAEMLGAVTESGGAMEAIGAELAAMGDALDHAWEVVAEKAAAGFKAVKGAGIGIGVAAAGLGVLYLATRK